jgi:hypothetical protein
MELPPHTRDVPPWTADEVASMNGYQASGAGHPFTCGNDECRGGKPDPRSRYAPLLATEDGWVCDWCGYTQDWAWLWMTDWSWRQGGLRTLAVFTGTHGNLRPG